MPKPLAFIAASVQLYAAFQFAAFSATSERKNPLTQCPEDLPRATRRDYFRGDGSLRAIACF
jgi:hypothetical protein